MHSGLKASLGFAFLMLCGTGAIAQTVADTTQTSAAREAARVAKKAKATVLLIKADQLSGEAGFAKLGSSDGKRRDVLKLRLKAGLLDEPASAEGLLTEAAAIRVNKQIDESERLEIAVLEESLRRRIRRFKNRHEWLDAREESMRRLHADFPGNPAVQQGLLSLSAELPPERALSLLDELVASEADVAIKETAIELKTSLTAPGKILGSVLEGTPGSTSFLQQISGRAVLIYSWAPEQSRSWERAKKLVQEKEADCLLMGVNVGLDTASALRVAKEQDLPGEQLYHCAAAGSPLVRRLGLRRPGMVYYVTREGIVHDLSSAPDPTAPLRLLKKGGR